MSRCAAQHGSRINVLGLWISFAVTRLLAAHRFLHPALTQALGIDGKRHDALWCLGNAYTSQGFLSAEAVAANQYFDRAGECFRKAVDLEPGNESYRRALDMSGKAPQLYQELQRQLQAASTSGGSPRAAEPRSTQSKQVGWDALD